MAVPYQLEVLARKIEVLLPPLDLAIGRLLGALPRKQRTRWKRTAWDLRGAYATLISSVKRLEKESLDLDAFTALWGCLGGLAEHGERRTIVPLARKARALYEPVWREVVRCAAGPPRGREEVVRGKDATDILCAGCRKPALRFARGSRYTGAALPPDEYRFLKPYVADMAIPLLLVAYLRKYLRFGVAEYCPPCEAFFCRDCSPLVRQRYLHSDHEPVLSTCPRGHERQVDT